VSLVENMDVIPLVVWLTVGSALGSTVHRCTKNTVNSS